MDLIVIDNFNQLMEENKGQRLVKYLAIGGALGLSYWIFNYLSSQKKSKVKALTLAKTQKILEEIKCHMLTACVSYLDSVNVKQPREFEEQQREITFRTNIAQLYENREGSVLEKLNITSLSEYQKNESIQKGQGDIYEMMERAVKGTKPDLTVPPEVLRIFQHQQIVLIYVEMLEIIATKVWQKFQESKRKNAGFNAKNQSHYKQAMNELNIFEVKYEFLQRKGFGTKWGCPNELFFKVMETIKQQNKDVKAKMSKIEQAYAKAMENISSAPENFSPERIKFLMEEIINKQQDASFRSMQPQREKQYSKASVSKSLITEVKGKPKEEDDKGLDNLMMQQLLNRSQEESKNVDSHQKKQEKPVEVQVKHINDKKEESEEKHIQNKEVQSSLEKKQLDVDLKQEKNILQTHPQNVIKKQQNVVEVNLSNLNINNEEKNDQDKKNQEKVEKEKLDLEEQKKEEKLDSERQKKEEIIYLEGQKKEESHIQSLPKNEIKEHEIEEKHDKREEEQHKIEAHDKRDEQKKESNE